MVYESPPSGNEMRSSRHWYDRAIRLALGRHASVRTIAGPRSTLLLVHFTTPRSYEEITMRISKTLSIAALCAAVHCLGASSAEAAPRAMRACTNLGTGVVTVRARCTRSERVLSVADLQLVGPQGIQGPQGMPGIQGPMGPVGPKGDTGAQGAMGPTGPQGLTGAVGATGPQGAQGAVGATGAQGPVGQVGPVGPRGESAFDVIPQGRTVYGVIGADVQASSANGQWGFSESLPAIAPVAFGNELVTIRNNEHVNNDCGGPCLADEEITHSPNCTGSVESPSAPPGWLCLYPVNVQNVAAGTLRATALPAGSSRHGFFVRWKNSSSGLSGIRMVWAYTAP